MFDDYIKKRETDGERINLESPAFRSTYQLGYSKVRPATTNSLKEVIRKLIIKSGLRINQVKTGKRYNKQADHGFRKRWNTILKTTKGMNISLAEKMMGHSVTVVMDNVYLDPTVQQLFAEFRKAIPELTIDSTKRQEFKITEQQKKITQLQEKETVIQELKKAQEETANRVDMMSGKIVSHINKNLDENKETSEEYLMLYGNLIRLQMDMNPEFAEYFKKLVSKQTDVPAEIKKKISEI